MTHDDMPCGFESYENDWLEVKYATPQQMNEEEEQKNSISKSLLKAKQKIFSKKQKNIDSVIKNKKSFGKKLLKPVGICVVVALLLVGMFFVDGGFVGDVFSYAKDNVTSNVSTQSQKNTLSLPANATVSVQSGDVTLTGGSIAVNLLQGTVADVTENSVTVCATNGLEVVYANLSEVLVAKNDIVNEYQVLGKYDQSAVVSLLQDGQKITSVTADKYTLSW